MFHEARRVGDAFVVTTQNENLSSFWVRDGEINVIELRREEDLFIKVLMSMVHNSIGGIVYEQ